MRYPSLCVLSALALIAPFSAAPASAGFFDSIFGTASAPPPPSEAASPGLNVTISPSRSLHRPRPQVVQTRRAAKQKPVREAARHGSIDPSQDGEWFLHDPTLRPGDIVVLERDVLMLNSRSGRGPLKRTDFTSLNKDSGPADARALLGSTIPVQSAANAADTKPHEIKSASLMPAGAPAAQR